MANEECPQAPAPQGSNKPPAPQDPPPPQNQQVPIIPNAPLALIAPQAPAPHIPQLNWSHFKSEYSGKPDEDAEAHLLRTNDWMDMHVFPHYIKVQRFCLTLIGEARLWYKSLGPINVDWVGSQNTCRQQYSKIDNTRQQLFHAWRSFYFDKNAETIDSYVNYIRQVATLLGYQEPQILEVFKNMFPMKLYWVLFPIMDLRQSVETAKRILTKEKIDNWQARFP